MIKLDINTGVKEIEVNSFGDTIKINTTDAGLFDRFVAMTDRIEKESDTYKAQYEAALKLDNDTDIIIETARARVDFSKKATAEIDAMFGADTVHKVFRECYEADADYIPDETSLLSFIEAIMPVLEKLFKDRMSTIEHKYSVNNKGARTKKK